MSKIIKGTTPTIKYTFSTVDVTDIETAYLTVKKDGSVVITKELSDATVGDDYLSWTLTQAESLSVSGEAQIMLNWLLTDGTRGASDKADITFVANHIEEEI